MEEGNVEIHFIRFVDQLGDFFTKALPEVTFNRVLQGLLMMEVESFPKSNWIWQHKKGYFSSANICEASQAVVVRLIGFCSYFSFARGCESSQSITMGNSSFLVLYSFAMSCKTSQLVVVGFCYFIFSVLILLLFNYYDLWRVTSHRRWILFRSFIYFLKNFQKSKSIFLFLKNFKILK